MTNKSVTVHFTNDRKQRANSSLRLINGFIKTRDCPNPIDATFAMRIHIKHVKDSHMCLFYWITLKYCVTNRTNSWAHLSVTSDCMNARCNVSQLVNGNVETSHITEYIWVILGDCLMAGSAEGTFLTGYLEDSMAWNYTLSASEMMTVKNYYT